MWGSTNIIIHHWFFHLACKADSRFLKGRSLAKIQVKLKITAFLSCPSWRNLMQKLASSCLTKSLSCKEPLPLPFSAGSFGHRPRTSRVMNSSSDPHTCFSFDMMHVRPLPGATNQLFIGFVQRQLLGRIQGRLTCSA